MNLASLGPQVRLEPTTLRLTVAGSQFLLNAAVASGVLANPYPRGFRALCGYCQLMPLTAQGPRYFPRYPDGSARTRSDKILSIGLLLSPDQ
jgi:hypothetical protein